MIDMKVEHDLLTGAIDDPRTRLMIDPLSVAVARVADFFDGPSEFHGFTARLGAHILAASFRHRLELMGMEAANDFMQTVLTLVARMIAGDEATKIVVIVETGEKKEVTRG
jgi:hypothetical protein